VIEQELAAPLSVDIENAISSTPLKLACHSRRSGSASIPSPMIYRRSRGG